MNDPFRSALWKIADALNANGVNVGYPTGDDQDAHQLETETIARMAVKCIQESGRWVIARHAT